LSSIVRSSEPRIRRRRIKDSVSKLAFRVSYLRRSRENYFRYLETKPWVNQLYTHFLNINPRQQVVDVGCGTGDFTRFLARLSKGEAKILGIDSNSKSIPAAISDTQEAGLSKIVSYKVGDVFKIPLEDDYADLTTCRTLLMHLTTPLLAVKEMARITKPGGQVVAVEGGRMVSFYDPDDERYASLANRSYEAWIRGVKKLEGKEFKIGEKLPGIFRDAGLSGVKAEIQADAWLYSDPRRKLSDIKKELTHEQSIFKERRRKDRKYLLAGGMPNSKITEYFNRAAARIQKRLSDDDSIRNDHSFYGASLILVSGTKTR
jgi:ubiquinone/menaquinone biosynthesis C-methylase UbiE